MPGPKNAGIQGDGFRFYTWEEPGQEPVHLLSVTSIKRLCGESHTLVNWQINNVINAAMGTTKRIVIGPKGGKNVTYVKDGPFPGRFATMLAATDGVQGKLDSTRAWLRETAEEPRDTAAVRGTIVHEAIEKGALLEDIDRDYVEYATERLSVRDKKKLTNRAKNTGGQHVTDEDIEFVRAAIANYWNMRASVPFVILAREPQVFNLTAGYGGSADALVWFLPEVTDPKIDWQWEANHQTITQDDIERVGGHVSLLDWKTGSGPFTDQVVQVMAYLAAEFVGADGVRDQRLTDILVASNEAAIVHVRADEWLVNFIDFQDRQDVLRGFLGSVAYARLLAQYPEPDDLFTRRLKGKA